MGKGLLIGSLILGACLLLPRLSEWYERRFGRPFRSWIFEYLDRQNKVISLFENDHTPRDDHMRGKEKP
jgi:hypothetical protein